MSHFADPQLVIRPARMADAAILRDLHLVTFREHAEREARFAMRPFLDPFLADLAAPPAPLRQILSMRRRSVLVAEVSGRVAGYLAATDTIPPFRSSSVFINDISIAPNWRRRGIGTALLRAAEARAAAQGHRFAATGVWPRNAASLAMFEAAGYRFRTTRGGFRAGHRMLAPATA